MASPQQPVSDSDRQRIEEELATALLLLYAGHRQQALAGLGVAVAAGDIPPEAVQKVTAFAADRAQKIQDGINTRLIGADDPAEAEQSIAEYNATTLQPYLQSWARHQGLIDAYSETPGTSPGITALRQAQWVWTQVTDFEDDCTEAADASPTSYDNLMALTGDQEPPLHENCRCSLAPV